MLADNGGFKALEKGRKITPVDGGEKAKLSSEDIGRRSSSMWSPTERPDHGGFRRKRCRWRGPAHAYHREPRRRSIILLRMSEAASLESLLAIFGGGSAFFLA